jgi:toxin ParE1/3/4
MRLDFSPEARADLESIWRYSFENWGPAQADRYVGSLRQVIEGLPEGHSASRPADEIRPGYRLALAGRHMVVFRQTGHVLEVIRVLHQRMDAGRWV